MHIKGTGRASRNHGGFIAPTDPPWKNLVRTTLPSFCSLSSELPLYHHGHPPGRLTKQVNNSLWTIIRTPCVGRQFGRVQYSSVEYHFRDSGIGVDRLRRILSE